MITDETLILYCEENSKNKSFLYETSQIVRLLNLANSNQFEIISEIDPKNFPWRCCSYMKELIKVVKEKNPHLDFNNY